MLYVYRLIFEPLFERILYYMQLIILARYIIILHTVRESSVETRPQETQTHHYINSLKTFTSLAFLEEIRYNIILYNIIQENR